MFLTKLTQYGQMNFDEISGKPLSGDRSWENCHRAFLKYRGRTLDNEAMEYLCLQLSWYLASWGMLRNSFLRHYSHKIHESAIRLVYDPEWNGLWDLDFARVSEKRYADAVLRLSQALNGIYGELPENTDQSITDTLQTKILLGTLGCVPAFDTYLKSALKNAPDGTGLGSTGYTLETLIALGRFYAAHRSVFDGLRGKWNASIRRERPMEEQIEYPSAKTLDMCLFQYGFFADWVGHHARVFFEKKGRKLDGRKIECRENMALLRAICLTYLLGDGTPDTVGMPPTDLALLREGVKDLDATLQTLVEQKKYRNFRKYME